MELKEFILKVLDCLPESAGLVDFDIGVSTYMGVVTVGGDNRIKFTVNAR